MQSALALIREKNLLTPKNRVLVAISGGRDSVALAHFLHHAGYGIALAHVNYGLRGEESDGDEAFVRTLALEWSVPLHVMDAKAAMSSAGNTQEKAREVRYTFFRSLCDEHGYTKTATAHHLEDSIETALLNLTRGTGIHGISGIRAVRQNIVRPLITTTRAEIDDYINRYGLIYREDSTNATDRYARNRLRHHVIPALLAQTENAAARTAQSLALIQDDRAALEDMAALLLEPTDTGYRIALEKLPAETRETWVFHSVRPFGFNRTQCRDLLNGTAGAIIESATHKATVQDGEVRIATRAREAAALEVNLRGVYRFGENRFDIKTAPYEPALMPKNSLHVWIDAALPLTIRPWRASDRFQPLGCGYEVLVSDFLKDKKADRLTKGRTAVVCVDSEIAWVAGFQVSEKFKCQPLTRNVVSIEILP